MTRGSSGLPAKVVRPPCTGALARSRLFRLLDRARRRPVVWVSGPPGSGKTTLVSSYVEARRIPCLWYRVDGGDADAATFFHYMGLAATASARGRRAPLPAPSPEFRPDPGTFARRYFEELCARLTAPALIVLDDLHEIDDASPLFEAIRDGATCLPKGITLVLASRAEPPPALVRLRAREMMTRIGWSDLRLTLAETRGVAGRRGMKAAGPDGWRRLHGLTDGWAAGVVLALSAGPPGAKGLPQVDAAPAEIFDYFAEEIFAGFGKRDRNLLLKLCFMPEATPSMAEEALGLGGAGALLAALARRNSFVEKRPGAEPSYRLHALFRAFLMEKARAAFSRDEVLRLRRSAAAVLERRGRPDEAQGLLREAKDWEGLSRLIRDHGADLVAQGRGQTLGEWLATLPASVRDADPWLSLWWAKVRLPYDPDGSRRDFERAFREFAARRDPSGVFPAWSGVVEAIMYGSEGLKPLDPWLASLDGLLDSFGGFPDDDVAAGTTLTMVKALSLRRPALASAATWAQNALAVSRAAEDGPRKVEALVNLAYYWYHGGEFRKTEDVLASLHKTAGRRDSSPVARLAAAWVEAAHANMHALHDRCLATVDAGLGLAAETGIHIMDYMLMGHGALAALHKGEPRAARRHFRAMEASLGSARPWEAAFYHFAAGWDALGRKDTGLARHHAEASLQLSERVGNPWTAALAHLQQAFLLHEEGAGEESLRSLSAARGIGREHGLAFVLFVCPLAEAYFLLERDAGDRALAALAEGLRAGRENGFDAVFVWRPGFLERVAVKALEEGIEVDYVRGLVRKNGLRPDEDRHDVEAWPWTFRIYTLGRFEIHREGEPLLFDRKAPQRPLLLLKALIALGGRDVPDERLIDLLWPDSEGDMGRQAFRANVFRLRKLIGHEAAIAFRDGLLTLDDRHCWVDVRALERHCRRIEDIDARGAGAAGKNIARLAARISALYNGPFLAGDKDRTWTTLPRQRFRNLLLRCLMLSGERMESEGDFESAASCYRKGVEVDGLAENLYQKLISCYRRLGKVAEASDLARKFPHKS